MSENLNQSVHIFMKIKDLNIHFENKFNLKKISIVVKFI